MAVKTKYCCQSCGLVRILLLALLAGLAIAKVRTGENKYCFS